MDWPRFSYSYDGSFAGFLTCVFMAYANKEEPACFLTYGDGRVTLWPQRTVDTDDQKARRVYRSLDRSMGQQGRRLVTYGFLTCLPEKDLALWEFLRLGYERGPGVVRDLTDDRKHRSEDLVVIHSHIAVAQIRPYFPVKNPQHTLARLFVEPCVYIGS